MFRRLLLAPLVVLVIFGVLGVAVWLVDRSGGIDEIGGTNLDVEFLVTDADSGQAIPNAEIHIRCDYGCWYDGADGDLNKLLTLKTDAVGAAHRQCRNNRWTSRRSRLHFTNYYAVWIPGWNFQVLADGFDPSRSVDMAEEYRGQEKHEGPGQERLTIRVALKKREGI